MGACRMNEDTVREVDPTGPSAYIHCRYTIDHVATSMHTKVRKWGNSLGLRIPKSFADEVSVEDGSTVDISVAAGQLVVRAVRPRKHELGRLLAEVSEENLHAEISTGEPRGRESW